MSEPITLENEPLTALHEIGSYLRSLSMSEDRKVIDIETNEIDGYWQTKEWLEGLLDIAKENVSKTTMARSLDIGPRAVDRVIDTDNANVYL